MATNKSKLVNWDADFYKSLPNEYCLYCLSKKQVYVLGQALEQAKWGTRWYGDTSGLDTDLIASELEGILAMSECGNLNDLYDIIIQMQNDISILLGVTENTYTDTPYTATHTPSDAQYYDTLTEPLQSSPCATNAERDVLYGGVVALADYLIANVTDFLEIVEQNVANPPELVENLVEAIPALGLLPFDDAIEYAGWLIDQLLDAWNATVTVDLIQDFYCELFCLALDHNCQLTLDLILGLVTSKLPSELGDIFKMSLQNALSFLVTGNFLGDDYFYVAIGMQLNVVAVGQQWLRSRGWKPYQYRFAAGKLEPNNGHEVFCTECPTYSSYIEYDFTISNHGFTAVGGTWIQGQGWVATITEPSSGNYRAAMTITKEFAGDLPKTFAGGMIYDVISNCGIEEHYWKYFLDDVEQGGQQVGNIENGYHPKTFSNSTSIPYVAETMDKVVFRINPADCDGVSPHGKGIIVKARIWLSTDSPLKGIPARFIPQGLPADGSGSLLYWGGV